LLCPATTAVAAGKTSPRSGQGVHYYVDCTHGSDSSSGVSPRQAWRTLARVDTITFAPGDELLFRRGTRCDGVLAPSGSGAAGEPIIVDAYGKGPEPQLAGDGARATVYLHNVDQWELHDLDISNLGPPPQPGEKRNGIWVVLDGFGIGHHYVIEDVAVHDVNSSVTPPASSTDVENYSKDSGGIIFDASGSNGFDDVLLQRDGLRDVNREGIYVSGSAPTTGLVIGGNDLRRIGGDGIVAVTSTGALIERNVVDGFNTAGTSFNAGVWGYNSDGDVFQFNDVSHGQHGPLDSMAYDIDGSNYNLLFQYNLSHDNSGGFLMLCNDFTAGSVGGPNGGSVVRYNISQNDHAIVRGVIDVPFACGGENNISVYNNTIYTRDPRVTTLVENTNNSTMHLTNNILVGPGPQATIYDKTGTWQNNLYLDVTCVARPPDPHAVVADPGFVAPGTATSLTDADGYRLRIGSPALGAGVPLPNAAGRDYYGNPIPDPPNIGAYQGPGVTTPGPTLDLSSVPLAPLC
jgi:hypothetical protein